MTAVRSCELVRSMRAQSFVILDVVSFGSKKLFQPEDPRIRSIQDEFGFVRARH